MFLSNIYFKENVLVNQISHFRLFGILVFPRQPTTLQLYFKFKVNRILSFRLAVGSPSSQSITPMQPWLYLEGTPLQHMSLSQYQVSNPLTSKMWQ